MTDPTSLPNFPPPAGDAPLRGRVLDALQDEGFRPDIDGDGDVSFKVEGQQLFVHCAEGEVPVMRVFGQWQIREDLPTDEMLRCYCTLVYQQSGSYLEAARRLGLDRRTVRARIDRRLLQRIGGK